MPATVYIGRYEARATPVADTDPATALGATVKLVAGHLRRLVRGAGYGLRRFTLDVGGGPVAHADLRADAELRVQEPGRVGAGAGTNQEDLIDDTESTTWDVTGATGVNVAPADGDDRARAAPSGAHGRGQRAARSRRPRRRREPLHGAARSGQSCAAANCSLPTALADALHEPGGRVPAIAPRPLAPDLTLRTFDVPDTVGDAAALHRAGQPVHGRARTTRASRTTTR